MQSSGQEGYSTTVGQPPQDGGQLPHTGADVTPAMAFGGVLLMVGIMVLAAVNGWRTPRAPRTDVTPAYLQGGVVPSTYNQE